MEEDQDLRKLILSLPEAERRTFYKSIILNIFIPVVPYYTQVKLLTSTFEEQFAFFGGGRGGGKTETILMGALQFVNIPSWQAGVLRITTKNSGMLGAAQNRFLKWRNAPYLLNEGIEIKPEGYHGIYRFPSGAQVQFNHVQYDKDVDNYQGAEYHRLLLDEAVQFSEHKLTRLKGSVRKTKDDPLPINIWYTGNPGGLTHDYFYTRFVKGSGLFIPSLYTDNPHLDSNYGESFLDSVMDENPTLGRQWKYGDWEAVPPGIMFERKWFTDNTYDYTPDEKIVAAVFLWDLAATEEEDINKKGGGDWTAGCLLQKGELGTGYLDNMVRFRYAPNDAEPRIFKEMGEVYFDNPKTKFRIEMEGGASPKYLINTWSKRLPGYDFDGWKVPRKDKLERARAMVSFIKHGHLKMRAEDWNNDFLSEITSFPTKGVHDDMVDALSGAFNVLFMGEAAQKPFVSSVEMW